jgi:hypothetical protein
MQPIRGGLMLWCAWLAGCSLVYSPADRQLGPGEQGSPIQRSDDEDDTPHSDEGAQQSDDEPSDVDVADDDQTDEVPETDETADLSPDDDIDDGEPDAGLDAGDVDPDEIETDLDETDPDAGGGMCGGSSGNWAGCGGDDCGVCAEKLAEFPRYLENHPACNPSSRCSGAYTTCDADCPTPTDADRDVQQCNGTPGTWAGCRGTGCWVCNELLQGYPRYAENHPGCIVNYTCDGQHYTCNAACPAPTEADR